MRLLKRMDHRLKRMGALLKRMPLARASRAQKRRDNLSGDKVHRLCARDARAPRSAHHYLLPACGPGSQLSLLPLSESQSIAQKPLKPGKKQPIVMSFANLRNLAAVTRQRAI